MDRPSVTAPAEPDRRNAIAARAAAEVGDTSAEVPPSSTPPAPPVLFDSVAAARDVASVVRALFRGALLFRLPDDLSGALATVDESADVAGRRLGDFLGPWLPRGLKITAAVADVVTPILGRTLRVRVDAAAKAKEEAESKPKADAT